MRRTLVAADLHLTTASPPGAAEDLARLVRENPGVRLVLAGDLLDLPAEEPDRSPEARARAVRRVFERHAGLRRALAEHLERAGEIWITAGNHDAELGHAACDAELRALLTDDAVTRARLRTSPWLLAEEGLHVEHGHLYDPDNAPSHPLVEGAPGLGVHFVERFLVPTGAYAFLHANDATPLRLFLRALFGYGWRGPSIVLRFFAVAFDALARSGARHPLLEERSRGAHAEPGFAREVGVPIERLAALRDLAASPTLTSVRRTFARLYLDRVAGTLALLGAPIAAAAGGVAAATACGVLGGGLLAASWARGHDRYGGAVPARLEAAASEVARASGAEVVVFGHTHVPRVKGPYANPGSFAFAPSPRHVQAGHAHEVGGERTYLEIERSGPALVASLRAVPR